MLIFADEHPVIVRLRVEVGGVGFRRNYRDFLGRLHAYLDGDGDGRLTTDEVKQGDWRQMFQGTPFNGGATGGGSGAEADGDGDGRVSIAELGDYLVAASGITPVDVQGGPPADPGPSAPSSTSTATATAASGPPSGRRPPPRLSGSTGTATNGSRSTR